MKYRYEGHVWDVFCELFGFVAYRDNSLNPQDISEEEYVEIVMNGVFIGM